MGFDLKAFNRSKFEPREKAVPVQVLAAFFSEGEEPVWKVRALTHAELSKVREAPKRDDLIKTAINALAGGDKDKQKMITEMLGDVNGVPERTRVRIEALRLCSVDPVCDQQMAVKIAEYYPAVLEHLTDTIFGLTDEGAEVAKKKPQNSGTTET